MRAAQRLLDVPTIGGGGVPGQGVVVEGVIGGKKAPTPAKIHKNGVKKTGQFPALFDLKLEQDN
jgi:hypothetical protein